MPFVLDSIVFLVVGMLLGLVLMRTFGKTRRRRAHGREDCAHGAHGRWAGKKPACS